MRTSFWNIMTDIQRCGAAFLGLGKLFVKKKKNKQTTKKPKHQNRVIQQLEGISTSQPCNELATCCSTSKAQICHLFT